MLFSKHRKHARLYRTTAESDKTERVQLESGTYVEQSKEVLKRVSVVGPIAPNASCQLK